MSANFSPEMEGYSGIRPFRFWCQKVLPLTYDDSLSYYELLCKVVDYLNNTINDLSATETNVDNLKTAYDNLEGYVNQTYDDLTTFVNDYFDNLDVQEEIDNKLDLMASNGTLTALLAPIIPTIITDWLAENITPTTPVVDDTLTISGAAADAKVTGDKFGNKSEGYVLFGTDGSIRGEAVSISGLLNARVVNNNYSFTLYYYNSNNQEVNSGWVKSIDVTEYKTPTKMVIRRDDNGAMPAGSANNVIVGTYLGGYATNEYVFKHNSYCFVDGTNGSDTNSGCNKYEPLKTINKALSLGFKKILVKEGTYQETITLNGVTGVSICLNMEGQEYNASTHNERPYVIIDANGNSTGIRFNWCKDILLEGIKVTGSTTVGVLGISCENVVCSNCGAEDNDGIAFQFNYCDCELRNCVVDGTGTVGENHDGFNFHGNGNSVLIDCIAHDCTDDGVSHHEGCTGTVIGGEFYNCGKAGIASPTYGCKVDIYGAYCHDNQYGIYAYNDTAGLAKTFMLSNCVLKNNAIYDINVVNNSAKIWNCKYDTINHGGEGSNTIF